MCIRDRAYWVLLSLGLIIFLISEEIKTIKALFIINKIYQSIQKYIINSMFDTMFDSAFYDIAVVNSSLTAAFGQFITKFLI